MAQTITPAQARKLLAALGIDINALVQAAAPVKGKAAAAVVVSQPRTAAQIKAAKFKAEVIDKRVLCAHVAEKCLDKDGKPHTFTPNGIGRFSHTTCAQGRAIMAALADKTLTTEQVLAGEFELTAAA